MKILVTFALETEFAPWRAMHDFRSAKCEQDTLHVAQIGGAEVWVLVTGVGTARASAAAARIIESDVEVIDACISSGFAGALHPRFIPGTIVAAQSILDPEAKTAEAGKLDTNPHLLAVAKECGAKVIDFAYTSNRPIATVAEKKRLSSHADVVEMESFGIVKHANSFQIPATMVRSISDLADEDLPLDFSRTLDPSGEVSVTRVLGELARHPGSIPGVVKLGHQSKRAAESLARFLDKYIQALVWRAHRLPTSFTAAVGT